MLLMITNVVDGAMLKNMVRLKPLTKMMQRMSEPIQANRARNYQDDGLNDRLS